MGTNGGQLWGVKREWKVTGTGQKWPANDSMQRGHAGKSGVRNAFFFWCKY